MQIFLASILALAPSAAAAEAPPKVWDLEALSRPPAVHPAPGFEKTGLRALFYDGLPWKGKPTRAFAWYGAPAGAAASKVPAMVLVHGGGGTAFEDWVRLWVSRGYAAIAMDTCGCTPGGDHGKRPRHDLGGPPGWGGFDAAGGPIEDAWTYHAVADVVLAHSLIRSFPEVDRDRTGVTGISWGGYLTCIAAGVDPRFKLAVPVYGCGFLGEDSCWLGEFEKLGPERARKWIDLWDPSVWLPRAAMPMLWVTGTNDFAYPMDSLRKSYRLPAGPRLLAVRIRMPHAHGGPGEKPEEIRAFVDSLFRGGPPLPRVLGQGREDSLATADFDAAIPVERAELCFTRAAGPWKDREWISAPAEIDRKAGRVKAVLPDGTRVWFFNLIDARGLVSSTEHEEL
jgi:dienelactone hydrolase